MSAPQDIEGALSKGSCFIVQTRVRISDFSKVEGPHSCWVG
ncbi:MAG: hypothetical protein ABSH34_06285 [Verrucomicrobiota bacterium]